MKRLLCVAVIGVVAALLVGGPALAGVIRHDDFTGTVLPGNIVEGSGTGFDGGRFIEYPVPGQPSWWNQWFYNDPPNPERWKWIDLHMDLFSEYPSDVIEIAINWTTMEYPENPNEPPLVDPGGLIGRYTVFTGQVNGNMCIDKSIEIISYNPEWVSIDIRVLDPMGSSNGVSFSGVMEHQCVPEPGTIVLLVMGALGVLFLRRRQ
ncbi:MAG: PEP-CTERM sorting domain-containing protein [Pirellulales bacterium]|nr:PEP-CTERM sorting domain-containing protein [Pirellulales bacterium]